jgi:hypothetical protein
MRKLLIVLTGVALFLAATNPAPCEFRAQVAESIRGASDRTSLSGRLKQELQATLLGEAVRLGTRRTDYLLFSVYTLDPTEALPEAVAFEEASWQYVGVGGFFIALDKPTFQLSSPSNDAPGLW